MSTLSPTQSSLFRSLVAVGSKADFSNNAPYLMSGANPDAESHLYQPLVIEDDSTVCTNDEKTILKHMPHALLPVSSFAHHFAPHFDPFHHFGARFFTTVRGLTRSLEIIADISLQLSWQRDWLLYNEIGSRGGTIPIGTGEHAMELVTFFEDEDCDAEFWEELAKEWIEGPWADWPVDDWGNERVPDPKRV